MERFRTRVFPLLSALLYAAFLWMDVTRRGDSAALKYAAILLCLLTALTGLGTADGRLVALALAFTAGADWFLLVWDKHYFAGVLLFCAVQLLYLLRLTRLRGRLCRAGLPLRLLPLLFPLFGADALSAAALFYFANLLCNAAEAFLLRPQNARTRRFALGLALFVCCDLCVGAHNLGLWTGFTRVGMWLFYLPSQVLIVLSAPSKGD